MQGIFINGQRPKSKKAVREAVAANPATVRAEATSMFGNEFDGSLAEYGGGTISFVGPDPYTDRRFYGTITVSAAKGIVVK
jgi:hypothetical protein